MASWVIVVPVVEIADTPSCETENEITVTAAEAKQLGFSDSNALASFVRSKLDAEFSAFVESLKSAASADGAKPSKDIEYSGEVTDIVLQASAVQVTFAFADNTGKSKDAVRTYPIAGSGAAAAAAAASARKE